MPKKVMNVQKKIVKKPVSRILSSKFPLSKPKKVEGASVEKILVENFVSLQKVMVNLSVKIDNLANQVSQLLNLFEISAKSLAERGADLGSGYEKRMMEKIDNIADQNKTMARGIAMLHEGEGQNFSPQQMRAPQMAQQVSQNFQMQKPINPEQNQNTEGYQKSISSKPQSSNKLPQG